MSHRFGSFVIALALVTTAGSARANGRDDAPRAEALFKEGRRLMQSGDFAAACPKFADSEAIQPAPGTALNLAVCYEKAGRFASAWAAFRTAQTAAQSARQMDRAGVAGKRADELEPTLSRLTLVVPAEAQVAGLEVRCDGEVVGQAEWGVAVPRDGGGHDVEATATGRRSWKVHVELAPRQQTLSVVVPGLIAEPTAPAPEPTVAAVSSSAPDGASTESAPSATRGRSTATKILAFSLGGLGLVGLGIGTYAGLTAQSTYHDAAKLCPGSPPTCAAGSPAFAQRDSASTWASVSTVAFIAGAAALASGVVLYFTAPRDTIAVGVGPTPGGVAVSFGAGFR
jgi:hypothetical protein